MKLEVSNGELIDKYTILNIKVTRLTDPEKVTFARTELNVLSTHIDKLTKKFKTLQPYIDELQRVNEVLWDIENAIRQKEQLKQFDENFITLARSVYWNNDLRGQLKLEINKITNSELREVKEYAKYTN